MSSLHPVQEHEHEHQHEENPVTGSQLQVTSVVPSLPLSAVSSLATAFGSSSSSNGGVPLTPTSEAFTLNTQTHFFASIGLLVDRINSLSSKVSSQSTTIQSLTNRVSFLEAEKKAADLDVELVSSLKQRVEDLEKKEASHAARIKTLAYNVSGGSPDDDDGHGGHSAPPPSMPQPPAPSSGPPLGVLNEAEKKQIDSVASNVNERKRRETESLAQLKATIKEQAERRASQTLAQETLRAEQAAQMQKLKEEQNKGRSEVEDMMKKMRDEFSEREKKLAEEAHRLEHETIQRMKQVEKEAADAKIAAAEAQADLKKREEEFLVASLRRSTQEGSESAQKALAAASMRQRTPPHIRERARKRWFFAFKKVMSPASKMKRTLARFVDVKVDKNNTVMARVDQLEKALGDVTKKLKVAEKQIFESSQNEEREGSRVQVIFDEMRHAILGTNVTIAIDQMNFRHSMDMTAPVDFAEPSHNDRVVNSLRKAAAITTKPLSGKLKGIADKLERSKVDDFDALPVTKEIVEVLQSDAKELKSLLHSKHINDFVAHLAGGSTKQGKSAGGGGDLYRTESAQDSGVGKVLAEDGALSMEDVLRLELHRLVNYTACRSMGGGNMIKRLEDLARYVQVEFDRIDEANHKTKSDAESKINAVAKLANQIATETKSMAQELNYKGSIDAMGRTVASVQDLLMLKAERESVEHLDGVLGVVKSDLSAIRSVLPDKDALSKIKSKLDSKMDKSEATRLMKGMKRDEDDPAMSKRCLSCSQPLPLFDAKTAMAYERSQSQATLARGGANASPKEAEGFEDMSAEEMRRRLRTTIEDPYQDYAKPTTPYKKFPHQRPLSAQGHRSPTGALSLVSIPKDHSKQDLMKFGQMIQKPLHITLFQNDAVGNERAPSHTLVSASQRPQSATAVKR